MKKLLVCVFSFIAYFFIVSQVQAVGNVSLSTNKSSVYVDDTFSVSINLSGVSVASLTSRMNIDTQKVEYVSGPSNSNYSNGRIIYTWTDPNGGASPITGGTIATFTFKAKSQGNANFSVTGDFFTPDEVSASPSFSGTTVSVKNIEVNPGGNEGTNAGGNTGNNAGGNAGTNAGGNTGTNAGGNTGANAGGNAGTNAGGNAGTNPGGSTGTNAGGNAGTNAGGSTGTNAGGNAGTNAGGSTGTNAGGSTGTNAGGNTGANAGGNTGTSSNNNLNSLQLDVEGISPKFNKNITQYYITIAESVTNINVTANPENSKSKVQVTGNNNIPVGTSKIRISVTSESGRTKEYVINVTKTNNPELSNTNLENLAIENITLVPEFNPDITDYTVEFYEDLDKLNILAVPQRENAKVTIEGNENLQYGDNVIKVTILAEDGASTKVYNILAQKKEKARQTDINEENNSENESREINGENVAEDITDKVDKNVKNNNMVMFIIIGILAILIIAVIIIIVKKKENKKKMDNRDN